MKTYKYEGVLDDEMVISLKKQRATFEKGIRLVILIVLDDDGTSWDNEQLENDDA